jgi:methionyl-tRNA formyltransferase
VAVGSTRAPIHIAYFGLPLGALLLSHDGLTPDFCVLSPVAAPGARRLRQRCARVLDAAQLGSRLAGAVEAELARQPPDLIVSWFWTRRLPLEWLERARIDAIGVHPSLLPRHRGRNPYYWAIDSGDVETGVSVHRLEAEYDVGAVLERESLVIGERNAWQLARALDRPSLGALRRVVAAYARGDPPRAELQDAALATPAPEPSGEFLRVDFHWPTARVLQRVRALAPVPGVPLNLANRDFFVIAATATTAYTPALLPGEAQVAASRLILRTGDGAIAVDRAALPASDDDEEPTVLTGEELALFFEEELERGPFKPRLG